MKRRTFLILAAAMATPLAATGTEPTLATVYQNPS